MSGTIWPVSLMCEVLEVSVSGYFSWKQGQDRPSNGPNRFQSDEALLAHMRAIHAQLKGEYGWPRMHKELLARGIRVGKERVRVLMQRHGIRATTKRKFVVTTDSKHHLPVAPDLVQRRFNPEAPNLPCRLPLPPLPHAHPAPTCGSPALGAGTYALEYRANDVAASTTIARLFKPKCCRKLIQHPPPRAVDLGTGDL